MSTTIFVILEDIDCYKCKAIFGMCASAVERYRGNGERFYCPYCNAGQSYYETREMKLKKKLAREKALHDQTRASRNTARADARAMKRSRDATRGVVTKMKKRIGKGVCPCCNRHFKNIERHMVSKHPKYSESKSDV